MAKTIIVDACVATNAGSVEPPASVSIRARAFLEGIREFNHKLGLTTQLEREWKDHAGRFALRWWRTMRAKRHVVFVATHHQTASRRRTLQTSKSANEKAAMEKDWHLIEAALCADRTVASSDATVRRLFARAAVSIPQLQPIVWVNPSNEDLATWLQADAPPDTDKQLG